MEQKKYVVYASPVTAEERYGAKVLNKLARKAGINICVAEPGETKGCGLKQLSDRHLNTITEAFKNGDIVYVINGFSDIISAGAIEISTTEHTPIESLCKKHGIKASRHDKIAGTLLSGEHIRRKKLQAMKVTPSEYENLSRMVRIS